MNEPIVGVVAALPWLVLPVLLAWRLRATPSLDSVPAAPPAGKVLRVSIVLPARNEAAHIAACIQSIQASSWPDLQLVVVNDHSTDRTGELAREAARGDPRIRVINAPDLPAGWFGKQWACEVGASHTNGQLLLFTDADTRHAPDLIARMVALRAQRGAELLSVAGVQTMDTVWEYAVQPSVLLLILSRYGGAASIERATHAREVIANGQCFMLSRAVYTRIGRHEAVRAFVAEDLMMAQAVFRHGHRVSLALGIRQLSTRMYDGLSALMKGWGKNLYAGGRYAMGGGAWGQRVYPILLLAFPLGILLPFLVLVTSVFEGMIGGATGLTAADWWSVFASGAILLTYAAAHRLNGAPLYRALLAPLGGAILLVICIQAIARGKRVEWKDRHYQAQ